MSSSVLNSKKCGNDENKGKISPARFAMLVVIAGVLFGSLASVMVRCSTAPSLVLAAYRKDREAGESLADYLEKRVFAAAAGTCVDPDPEDRAGFQTYIARYKAGLAVEKAAAEALA